MKNRPHSILLLSGGLDSTVSLAQAARKTKVILCLTFDYGQKAAKQEIRAARKITRFFRLLLKVIKLPWLKEIGKNALTRDECRVPLLRPSDFGGQARFKETARQVWVPNRNAVFIAVAAAHAEAMRADLIVTGFNAEEAKTFPDNSAKYVAAVNQSLKYSVLRKVKVLSYTQKLTKKQIVTLARKLKAPLNLIYSCYVGAPKPCGECESCLRQKRAFDA
jgi:7-cyano-7-deazaguanine synthase